jgi:hypothetical protein
MNSDRRVQPLQRIRLALAAGSTAEDRDIPAPVEEFAFILGIGSGGMTPFECLLNGRAANETIAFDVAASDAGLFFGALLSGPAGQALSRLFAGRETVYFTARILAMETPEPREVIKAMADLAAHAHGCDCGCGCG